MINTSHALNRQFAQVVSRTLHRFEVALATHNPSDPVDQRQVAAELLQEIIGLGHSMAAYVILANDPLMGDVYGPPAVRLSTLAEMARIYEDTMSQLQARLKLWETTGACANECCAPAAAIGRAEVVQPEAQADCTPAASLVRPYITGQAR